MSRKVIKEKIKNRETIAVKARKDVVQSEILKTEATGYMEVDSDEKTYEITQEQIRKNVSVKALEQAFKLDLENGPIYSKYSRNGVHMLLRNDRGYVSSFNSKSMNLHFEIDVKERIYDALYLHNERFIAVAQKNNVFIYNGDGVEVHCVREHSKVFKMEYLPYHYLLVTAATSSFLKYQDVSVGKTISEICMKDKNITSMKQNPRNAIIHTGSIKGVVNLWSPNSKEYLMKVLCHKNTVSNIEIDRSGNYMITTGLDNRINVWDLRNTYTGLNSLRSGFNVQVSSLSQKDMLAVGFGDKVHIWKDFINSNDVLYMRHRTMGKIVSSLDFCNYEDILCVGHSEGISNIIIPGSGDPVYDSYEDSPFMSRKMRSEKEVRDLLQKIPYELISTESVVGSLYKVPEVNKPTRKQQRYFDIEPTKRGALSRFYKKDTQSHAN